MLHKQTLPWLVVFVLFFPAGGLASDAEGGESGADPEAGGTPGDEGGGDAEADGGEEDASGGDAPPEGDSPSPGNDTAPNPTTADGWEDLPSEVRDMLMPIFECLPVDGDSTWGAPLTQLHWDGAIVTYYGPHYIADQQTIFGGFPGPGIARESDEVESELPIRILGTWHYRMQVNMDVQCILDRISGDSS